MKNLYDYYYIQIKEAVNKMEERVLKEFKYSFIDDSLIELIKNNIPKETEILKRDVFDIIGWNTFILIDGGVAIDNLQIKMDLIVNSPSPIEPGIDKEEIINTTYKDDLAKQILCHYCKDTLKLQDNKINEKIINDALEEKARNRFSNMIERNDNKPKYVNINIARAIPYGVSNINKEDIVITEEYEDKLMQMFKVYDNLLPLTIDSNNNNETLDKFTINIKDIIGYINTINDDDMITTLHVDRLEELFNMSYLVIIDMIEKKKLMICNDWMVDLKSENKHKCTRYIKSKLLLVTDKQIEYRKDGIEKRDMKQISYHK